jgi:PqqD family protein of HPr-rel-A system
MAEPIGTFWKVPRLIWKSWDEEVVVFNLASGYTHFLNPVAAQALKILEQEPLSADELSQRLALSDGLASDKQLIELVKNLLSKFDEMGLIEPAF